MNPASANVIPAASAIAAKLVRNNSIAPRARSLRSAASVTPTDASGGTRATAMPTPGRADPASLRTVTYAPAAPAKMAMPRSAKFGAVLAMTSAGIGVSEPTRGMSRAQNHPMKIPIAAPEATIVKDVRRRVVHACTRAAAYAMIGVMRGATSIAPMTTAVLSFISPSAAIDDENTISAVNRNRYGTRRSSSKNRSSRIAARCAGSRSRPITLLGLPVSVT